MKNKAVIGIIILGLYFTVDSSFQLYVKMFKPGYYSWYASVFWPLPEKIIFIRCLLSVIFRIFELISGIGILLRKEIFRKLILFISWFTIIIVYWKHPFGAVLRHTDTVLKTIYQANSFNAPACSAAPTRLIAGISLGCLYAFDIGVSVFAIYYFTRPYIKEQFKRMIAA